MRLNEFFYALGDSSESVFKILPKLGNYPNVLFILIGVVLLFIWIRQMAKYNKEAEERGTLK